MTESDRIRWFAPSAEDHQRIRSAAAEVFSAEPRILAAYLYGSATRLGHPARDIDVGVLAAEGVHLDLFALANELMRVTGIRDVPFDVRILNAGGPVFLHEVVYRGSLVYEADRQARVAFEARAISSWLDFKPRWERMRKIVLSRWSHG